VIDIDALVLGPCLEAWGQTITFMPARGLPQPGILGRFEEKFRTVSFTDGDEAVVAKPMLGARASVFTQLPVKGDIFQIEARLWQVVDVLPDGNGHLHIGLALANDAQVSIAPAPPSTCGC
jgi:hypothetical protein